MPKNITPTSLEEGIGPRAVMGRLLSLARPYLLLLLAVACFTLLFAGGRYARAYLMKPMLDGILLPAVMESQPSQTPTAAEVAPIEIAPARATETGPTPERTGSELERESQANAHIRATFESLLWAAGIIVLITPLALFGQAYLTEYIVGRMQLDLQKMLAEKLLALPLARHLVTRSGDLLTRVQHDANAAVMIFRLLFQDFFVSGGMILVGLASLFYISWQLSLLALAVAPPIAGVLLVFGGHIRRSALRRQAQLGQVTQRLVGILSGIKIIKAFGAERHESDVYAREAQQLFRRQMRVARQRVSSRSAVEALNSAAGVGVLAVALALVLGGQFGLTAGDVAWFATALATTYKPVKNLSKGWGSLMEQLASGQRLLAVLEAEEEAKDPPDAVHLGAVRKSIRFDGVHFAHRDEEGNELEVLRGIDLDVGAGEVIAIVGRTGAGKTTLMDLLMRFYAPTKGRILIDGHDLQRVNRRSLLDEMAMVGQDAFLFDTSILENIRYGRPDASDADVLAAARSAQVDEFVRSLPREWETEVGEFGVRLSGGQRQRITIARALLAQPSILIFDEATSALDARTEKIIQDAIEALRGARTIFMVAHRVSTLRRADRIVVLEAGEIVDVGDHEQLMKRAGLYADFVALQQNRKHPGQDT